MLWIVELYLKGICADTDFSFILRTSLVVFVHHVMFALLLQRDTRLGDQYPPFAIINVALYQL